MKHTYKKFFLKIFPVLFAGIMLLTACGSSGTVQNHEFEKNAESKERYAQMPQEIEVIWENLYPGAYYSETGSYRRRLREDGSSVICYTDFATNQEVVLCSQLNCKHDSESCTAWADTAGSVVRPIPVGDKVILLYFGNPYDAEVLGDAVCARVEIMNPDGTDRHLIHKFSPSESFAFKPYGGLARDAENIYFAMRGSPDDPLQNTVYKANIKTEEVVPVYQMTHEEEHIIGGIGSDLVIEYTPGSFNLDIPSEELVTQVIRVNPGTNEVIPLFEHGFADAGGCKDGMYISLQAADHMLRCYDLKDGSMLREIPVELGDPSDMLTDFDWTTMYFMGIYDGKIMVNGYPVNTEELRNWVCEDPEHHSIPRLTYGIDSETGTVYEPEIEFRDGDGLPTVGKIAAETETEFLYLYGRSACYPVHVIGSDGKDVGTSSNNNLYGFINKEDFWNNTGKITPIIDATK